MIISGSGQLADRTAAQRFSRVSVVGLILLFGYLLAYHSHHYRRGDGWNLGDFPTFYQAAEFARQHRDIYAAGQNAGVMYVYPPLIAFLYTPFTLLPIRQAAQVSLVINTAMLLTSLFLGARVMLRRLDACRPGAIWTVMFLASVLSENEMRAVLTMLETDPIMLLMFILALYWLDRRPTWAGMALALALNIKYLTIVAVPYLILRRRWQALVGMAVGTIFFALLPSLLLGWHEDLRCIRVALGGLLVWFGVPREVTHAIRVHNIADELSVSITSMLARVLGPHGVSNPGILALATAVGFITLAMVALLYRAKSFPLLRWPPPQRQETQPFKGLVAMEWAGLIVVALAFSPDTNTRHLVLTVLVNLLAAVIVLTPRPGVSRTPAVIGALLIFFAYMMPFGTQNSAPHFFYFHYGVPCWGLLVGYLLILRTGLQYLGDPLAQHA